MGYFTYVGKGMVLICAAPGTSNKLTEKFCETVGVSSQLHCTAAKGHNAKCTSYDMTQIFRAKHALSHYIIRNVTRLQGLPLETYVAAYKYGSVVIFNGGNKEQEVLKLCREFCSEPTKQNYSEGLSLLHCCTTMIADQHLTAFASLSTAAV